MASRNNRVFSLPQSVMDGELFPESRAFCEDLFLEVSVSGSVKTSSEAGSLQGDEIRSESDLDSEGSFNEITSVGTGSFVENATLEFDSLDLGYPGLSCSMEAIFASAGFKPSPCISAPEMAETVVDMESPSFRVESFPDRRRYYHTVWVEDVEIPETVFETLPANSVVVVNSSVTKENFTPPDGGFGWVVVAATFLISFLLSGFVKSLSAFPAAIFEEFPAATPEEVAWIAKLIGAFTLLFSPATGALSTSLGFGTLVLVGGLLCSAGLGISYFATSAGFLIGSLGALVGIGASLAVTSSIVCVARYFTTKRPLAMSVALSGGCVGALVLSPGLTAVISTLGLRYTFLVLAGVFHLISVCSLVFGTPEKRFRREVIEIPLAEIEEDISEPLEDIGICTKTVRSVSEALGLRYFKECQFLLTAASVFAAGMGITHILQYIPQQARSLGIEEGPATMLMFYAAVSDLVTRLSYGLLASRSPFPRTVEYTASIVISTTSIVLIPFCTSYWHLIVTSVLVGVGSGLWTILVPLLLSGIHGVENLCSTLSLVRLFQGSATLIFSPVVSAIRARWGIESVLIFAVSKMSIAGVLSLVLLLLIQVRNKTS